MVYFNLNRKPSCVVPPTIHFYLPAWMQIPYQHDNSFYCNRVKITSNNYVYFTDGLNQNYVLLPFVS